MYFLALDLGSTYTKAALVEDAAVLRQVTRPTPPPCRQENGRWEIDADAYFAQVQAMLEELHDGSACALLISTQMHGFVLADDAFRPLSPYVSWRDTLGAQQLPAIRRMLGEESTEPAGVPLKGNLALCALLARRLMGEAPPAQARLCTLGGYIIGRLTGAYVCHMTNAAPTGLADVRRGSWNGALLAKAGLAVRLPRIITGLQGVGTWRGVTVYPDLGDQQVCAAGAGLLPERSLHVSVGTAGLIGALTAQWATGAVENRPWITPGLYLRTVSGLPGGRHLAGLAHLLGDFAQRLGSGATEEQVWAFLTSCVPARHTAAADPWQRLTLPAEEWVAALYMDFAAAYAAAAERLQLPVRQLAFSGGAAAKNPALRRAICQAFGCGDTGVDHDAMRGLMAIAAMLNA